MDVTCLICVLSCHVHECSMIWVRHDSSIWDIAHSCLWHDDVTCLIHVCDMTRHCTCMSAARCYYAASESKSDHVRESSWASTRARARVRVRARVRADVRVMSLTSLVMARITSWHVLRHGTYIHAESYVCDMTRSYLWYDWCICWHIYVYIYNVYIHLYIYIYIYIHW